MERATFFSRRRERTLKGLILDGPGVAGNASTWLDGFAMSWGSRSSGGYPDSGLFSNRPTNWTAQAELCYQLQRGMAERVMVAPFSNCLDDGGASAGGGTVAQRIQTYPYTAPYEDIRLAR